MLTKTIVTVVLRKEVADEAAAVAAYEMVKTKLADQPTVDIKGSINTQIVED